MKRQPIVFVGSVVLLALLCSFLIQPKKMTNWMMGDSTMSIKDPNKFPETGWGVAFAEKFEDHVQIVNKAKNGRSTKSFIKEGIWNEVEAEMRQGDYLFIQFGHNDEKIDKPNTGTSICEYKRNLALFVARARQKGVFPVLLTPIARRSFVDGKLADTHKGYPEAMRHVADSLDVTLIDLTKMTSERLTQMGEEQSVKWFLHLRPGHQNYPSGVRDDTHLNDYGAYQIANLVTTAIAVQQLALAKDLKKEVAKQGTPL